MAPCGTLHAMSRKVLLLLTTCQLFPIRKIASKPIQAFIFHLLVWKILQEDFVIYIQCQVFLGRSIKTPSGYIFLLYTSCIWYASWTIVSSVECIIICFCLYCCCLFVLFFFYCLFVVFFLHFFKDNNMISISTVEFRYYLIIIILVNSGKS